MRRNRVLEPFWILYAILAFLFLRLPFPVSWDPAEYLAYGKFIFGKYGFNAYYRPPVWPLLLGFLWKCGFPMPQAMKIVGALLYLLIPLIPYFSLKGPKRYLGLLIASHPIFFKWSHLPLAHIVATFFMIVAYSTEGFTSGVFAALSGLSRFPFLLFSAFHVIGDSRKFLGAFTVFAIYLSLTTLFYSDPFAQIKKASEVIGWSKLYNIWPQDPFFYLRILARSSPLLFLGFFTLSRYSLSALVSLLFFTCEVYRKEDRFLIDILPYLALALQDRRKIIYLTLLLNFLQLPFITVFQDSNIYGMVENNSTVIGMHPGVNAYKNVHFIPWFDYFAEMPFEKADYCIYFRDAIPCPDTFCTQKVMEFYEKCASWEILYNESDRIIIGRKPTQRQSVEPV